MDEQTALVLALQLVALFSIAGALLLYLLCKIRNNSSGGEIDESIACGGKTVLVTSCDNAIGLQIAVHLANRGFRVFAGTRDLSSSNDSSASRKVITAWQKYRESLAVRKHGSILTLPFDVTREDVSHEAVDLIRAHLPAGEDGVWAIVNTSGISYRGRFDQQDVEYWDAMLKTNVVGLLRTAKIFQGLLRNTGGRMINIGCGPGSLQENGLVAYTATRYAVEGACNALRQELAPLGVRVISLHPRGISPDVMFVAPKLRKRPETDVSLDISGVPEYYPNVLTSAALQTLDVAISTGYPQASYTLNPKGTWYKPLCLLKVV